MIYIIDRQCFAKKKNCSAVVSSVLFTIVPVPNKLKNRSYSAVVERSSRDWKVPSWNPASASFWWTRVLNYISLFLLFPIHSWLESRTLTWVGQKSVSTCTLRVHAFRLSQNSHSRSVAFVSRVGQMHFSCTLCTHVWLWVREEVWCRFKFNYRGWWMQHFIALM